MILFKQMVGLTGLKFPDDILKAVLCKGLHRKVEMTL